MLLTIIICNTFIPLAINYQHTNNQGCLSQLKIQIQNQFQFSFWKLIYHCIICSSISDWFMALSLGMKNSNKILSQMKSKVGLLSLIKQSSCTCSMNSHYNKTPLTAAPFARAFKSPDSNFRFSPSLFLACRFESIKAGKQLDSFGSSVNNPVHSFWVPTLLEIFFPFFFVCLMWNKGFFYLCML